MDKLILPETIFNRKTKAKQNAGIKGVSLRKYTYLVIIAICLK